MVVNNCPGNFQFAGDVVGQESFWCIGSLLQDLVKDAAECQPLGLFPV